MELVTCPECGVPGEVLDAWTCASTDGPLAHVTIRCLHGHRFTGLRERLVHGPAPAFDAGVDAVVEAGAARAVPASPRAHGSA